MYCVDVATNNAAQEQECSHRKKKQSGKSSSPVKANCWPLWQHQPCSSTFGAELPCTSSDDPKSRVPDNLQGPFKKSHGVQESRQLGVMLATQDSSWRVSGIPTDGASFGLGFLRIAMTRFPWLLQNTHDLV
ncbi:hypothetical protein CSPX01_12402 [Colletotrichum filicis]|nr:hypothetical protein CSPX01_12402 [Colletotrichum filicis]